MTCANCGTSLNGKYRIIAFDRPRRVDVKACPGRCAETVRGWDAGRLELHVTGQLYLPVVGEHLKRVPGRYERRYATR